jgi:hypothetical protein
MRGVDSVGFTRLARALMHISIWIRYGILGSFCPIKHLEARARIWESVCAVMMRGRTKIDSLGHYLASCCLLALMC